MEQRDFDNICGIIMTAAQAAGKQICADLSIKFNTELAMRTRGVTLFGRQRPDAVAFIGDRVPVATDELVVVDTVCTGTRHRITDYGRVLLDERQIRAPGMKLTDEVIDYISAFLQNTATSHRQSGIIAVIDVYNACYAHARNSVHDRELAAAREEIRAELNEELSTEWAAVSARADEIGQKIAELVDFEARLRERETRQRDREAALRTFLDA